MTGYEQVLAWPFALNTLSFAVQQRGETAELDRVLLHQLDMLTRLPARQIVQDFLQRVLFVGQLFYAVTEHQAILRYLFGSSFHIFSLYFHVVLVKGVR
jgi:hypothetical protein